MLTQSYDITTSSGALLSTLGVPDNVLINNSMPAGITQIGIHPSNTRLLFKRALANGMAPNASCFLVLVPGPRLLLEGQSTTATPAVVLRGLMSVTVAAWSAQPTHRTSQSALYLA